MTTFQLAALAWVMLMSGLVIEGGNAPVGPPGVPLSGPRHLASTVLGFCAPPPSHRAPCAVPAASRLRASMEPAFVAAYRPLPVQGLSAPQDRACGFGSLVPPMRGVLRGSKVRTGMLRGSARRRGGATGLSCREDEEDDFERVARQFEEESQRLFLKLRLILLRSPKVEW